MPEDLIEVIAVGECVSIAGGDIDGNVTAIQLSDSGTSYRVVWWNGNVRCCEWLESCEVGAPISSIKQRVGFRHNSTGTK